MWRYIFKGFHFSFPNLPRINFGNKKTFKYLVKFDSSCLYTPNINNHTNKLCGISFGNHKDNSVRFGWRSDGKKIELMYLIHEGSKFYYGYLSSLKVNKFYEISISLVERKVIFFLSDMKLGEYIFKDNIFNRWGYYLYPYFGGKDKAPHFMKIWLSLF